MQTRELVAGVELDALIAEKVMGWRNWTGSDQSGLIGGTWSPSTSIDAAWQVVEHLAQMDPPRWLEIGRRAYGWSISVWVHCQAHGDRCEALDRPAWIDAQESAPLGICRAALAAVGHDFDCANNSAEDEDPPCDVCGETAKAHHPSGFAFEPPA